MNKEAIKHIAIGAAGGLAVGALGSYAFFKARWAKKHEQIFNDQMQELTDKMEKAFDEGYQDGLKKAQIEYGRKIAAEEIEEVYHPQGVEPEPLPEVELEHDPELACAPEPPRPAPVVYDTPKVQEAAKEPIAAEVGDHPFLKMYGQGVKMSDLIDPAELESPKEDPEEIVSSPQSSIGRLIRTRPEQGTVRLLGQDEWSRLDANVATETMIYYDEDDVVAYMENDATHDDTGLLEEVRKLIPQFAIDTCTTDPDTMYAYIYDYGTCVEFIRYHASYTAFTGLNP